MKVVVTGASGSVGTALLRLWADGGPDEVVGICRRPPPSDEPPYHRARWVAADVSEPQDERLLAAALDGADQVVHLAWQIQPSRDAEQMRRVNVEGSWRVVEAARRAGVRQVVHLSSIAAYRAGGGSPALRPREVTTGRRLP